MTKDPPSFLERDFLAYEKHRQDDPEFNALRLSVRRKLKAVADQATGGGLVKNVDFIGMNVTAVDINSSVNALSDGMVAHCNIGAIASVANIDTLIDAGGYLSIENRGTDVPAEAGGLVPVATPKTPANRRLRSLKRDPLHLWAAVPVPTVISNNTMSGRDRTTTLR